MLTLNDGNGVCQRLTRERAYSPVLKYSEGLWKSQRNIRTNVRTSKAMSKQWLGESWVEGI